MQRLEEQEEAMRLLTLAGSDLNTPVLVLVLHFTMQQRAMAEIQKKGSREALTLSPCTIPYACSESIPEQLQNSCSCAGVSLIDIPGVCVCSGAISDALVPSVSACRLLSCITVSGSLTSYSRSPSVPQDGVNVTSRGRTPQTARALFSIHVAGLQTLLPSLPQSESCHTGRGTEKHATHHPLLLRHTRTFSCALGIECALHLTLKLGLSHRAAAERRDASAAARRAADSRAPESSAGGRCT
eukprot:2906563-Rhodomonas_salina.4